MFGFKLRRQRPPDPTPVAPGWSSGWSTSWRWPEGMRVFPQEDFPVWDTRRIVAGGGTTWSGCTATGRLVVSGEELEGHNPAS